MILRRHHIQQLGASWMPFADAASDSLPLGQLLRLSLFQVSVGMAQVLLLGTLNRVMIVGKGSLFLGRLTNLFDGVSFVIEKNSGIAEDQNSVSKEDIRNIVAESLRNLANNL